VTNIKSYVTLTCRQNVAPILGDGGRSAKPTPTPTPETSWVNPTENWSGPPSVRSVRTTSSATAGTIAARSFATSKSRSKPFLRHRQRLIVRSRRTTWTRRGGRRRCRGRRRRKRYKSPKMNSDESTTTWSRSHKIRFPCRRRDGTIS